MMRKDEFSFRSIFTVILVVMLSLGFGAFAMGGIEIYVCPEEAKESKEACKLRQEAWEMQQEAARQARQVQMSAVPVIVSGGEGAARLDVKTIPWEDMARMLYGAENAARKSEQFLRDMEDAQRLASESSLPMDAGSLVVGGNGAKEISVGKFDRIMAYNCVQVQYRQGPFTGKVEIVADDSDIESLSVTESDGMLDLRYLGGGKNNVVVKVTAPALSEVTLFGTSTFSTMGIFDTGKEFHLQAYGATNANFGEIRGDSVMIDAYSACRVYALAVDVDRLAVNASSASQVRLKGLNAGVVTASALSAADVTLGGRCNSLSSTELSEGKVNARGLIVGAHVRATEDTVDMKMPRSPMSEGKRGD